VGCYARGRIESRVKGGAFGGGSREQNMRAKLQREGDRGPVEIGGYGGGR